MKISKFVFFAACIASLLVHGQSVPEILNYQGRILKDGFSFDGETNVLVALYNSETAGTMLFSETQTVEVVDGFYSLQMGSVNTSGLADAFDSPEVYLETTIGTTVLTPRERVLSSAYAIHAKSAEVAEDYLPLAGGTMTGPLTNNSHLYIYAWTNIVASGRNISIGDGARSYSCSTGSVAIGVGATSRYRTSGVAIGSYADGDYNGISIGYHSDGQYSNIAIGYASSAYSGYDRIAIGRSVTNRRNNSCAIRGTLYLDGGTGLLYRAKTGTGSWTAKAFTIPHPLDPENKVLRHYSIESPVVWNLYAGSAQLKNGEATIDLPSYYAALNLAGSESYTLTAVGAPASLYIKKKVENTQFVIAGNADVEVSWSIKVKRNDPGCLKGLKQLPVEQSAAEIENHRSWLESQHE